MQGAATTPGSEPQKISRGGVAGTYQAFPDVCRLKNGELLAVFYAGYTHVSLPNAEYPNGGRLCLVRSRDEGRTWTAAETFFDDPDDNRDPHIAQLPDGSLICSFFSLRPTKDEPRGYKGLGVQIVRSTDGGKTWEKTARNLMADWFCSAPVRILSDGTLLLGVYHMEKERCYGGVLRSTDNGKTWSDPIPIGANQTLWLDAETDIIALKTGMLFAALRSSKINMHYATSRDSGRTWTEAKDIGFPGHAPHLYRLSTGEILLSHRLPQTALHVSRDENKTWQGPYTIDTVGGAYPSCVELHDGTVLAVYYEEGAGSAVRARRFRLGKNNIEFLPPYGA